MQSLAEWRRRKRRARHGNVNCMLVPIISSSDTNGICNVKNCKSPIHNAIVMDDSWIASHLNVYLAAVIKESAGNVKGVFPAAFRYLENHPAARKQINPTILYNAYRNGMVRIVWSVHADVGVDVHSTLWFVVSRLMAIRLIGRLCEVALDGRPHSQRWRQQPAVLPMTFLN